MSIESVNIPDAAARNLALDPSNSYIVQAPAGSGKTTLLATRFVNLLARVQRPEEILAITFTKKAAAEMRHRVLAMLREDTAAAAEVRARNANNGWQLFDNPNVLKIQTIDSFALEVASQTPYLGTAAGLGITEHADEFYSTAARRLLARLYHSDPSAPLIAEFLAFLDNDAERAERLLAFMLSRRDQWLAAVTAVAAGESLTTTASLLQAAIAALRASVQEQLDMALSSADAEMINTIAAELGLAHDTSQLFAALMTKQGQLRKRLTSKDGLADPELRRHANAWLEQLHERGLPGLLSMYVRLPTPAGSGDAALQTLHMCCICLALAAAELDTLLRQAGLLDFTGLLIRAKQALRDEHGPTDLALYLDYRIHHILVDEYQDTSRAQFEFFNLLTEGWQQDDGNTFFAVGDPMQSIYRFRDADVSIFADTRSHGLQQIKLTPCTLTANFRSDPAVVDWCNQLFAQTFGQAAAGQLGEVEFSAAIPMVKKAADAHVSCLRFEDSHDETQHLLTHIRTLLAEDEHSTIAVLCRARNHVAPLLNVLSQVGIEAQATDMDLLASRPVIGDLMSLHTVLLEPSERLAWFSLLRSPLFGLTLTDMSRLADVEFQHDLSAWADPYPPLKRLNDALLWARTHLYEVPLREVLEGFWFRCGGASAYSASERTDAAAWFDLIDDLQSQAYQREALDRALTSLFASSNPNARLQVMTIHKAKGLEFEHVLVPYLERRAQTDEPQLLLWRAAEQGLLMGVRGDTVHAWLTAEERERAKNEEKRLLYVACTRAKRSLLTSFTCPTESRVGGMAKWLQNSAVQHEHHGAALGVSAAEAQGDLFNLRSLRRLPADYVWQPPAYPKIPAAESAADSNTLDPISARYEVALGLLVHRALAWLGANQTMPDLEAVSDYVDRHLAPRLIRWAKTAQIDEQNQTTLVNAGIKQLTQTLRDPQGRWLLAPHAEAHSEWPLTGLFEGELTKVVIDRTFVADGVRWIVDFKTGQPYQDENMDAFIQREVARYTPQLSRYRSMLTPLSSEPVATTLYFTACSRRQAVH